MHQRANYTRPRRPARKDEAPPHNIEVEERLLACMMRDNDAIDEVAGAVGVDDLFRDSHQILFREMLALHAKGDAFDMITLGDHLEGQGVIDRVGGRPALSHLAETVMFHSLEVEFYARIVAAHALRRRLIQIGTEAIDVSLAQDETPEDLAASIESKIADALTRHVKASERRVGEIVDRVYASIIRARDGEVAGFSTGLTLLDDMITGIEPGRFVVIAGRPGMGKTGLGINIAEHIARFHDRVVYVFSLEMMEDELVKRMVSSIGRVAGDKLKGRLLLTDAELRRVASARDEIRKLPIVIDDGSAKTVSKIRSQARLARRKHGADVIIVDHIGLIHPDSDNRGESRQQHIGKCSRMLKNLARDLKIPVIGLAQLNRNNVERQDKRPTISDLRESGDIEQDADTVLLIHRPDYYDREDRPGQAEIIVGKQRDGGTGIVHVKFTKEFTRFEDLPDQIPPGVIDDVF